MFFTTRARIVSRGKKMAGLFLPMDGGLPEGIYEVREVMGTLMIKEIGQPAMMREQFLGIDLESLYHQRCITALTQEELNKACPH